MRTKSLLTALACAAAFYAYADKPSAPPPEEAAGPVTELPPVDRVVYDLTPSPQRPVEWEL